jgi:hypothetical protein
VQTKVVTDDDDQQATPTGGTFAQTVLEGAKSRLATTQSLLVSSSKNFVESTKLVIETQAALDTVKARLAELTNSVMKLVSAKGQYSVCHTHIYPV